MSITVPGAPTNAETTLSVTANVTCVPTTLLGPTGEPWGVLWEVLGGPVYYTLHDVNATPDQGDFVGNTGDQFFTKPATRLRLIRASTDTCVKMQAFQ